MKPLRLSGMAGLVTLITGAAGATEPFRFTPPAFLGAPAVMRAATGSTWQFAGDTARPLARLTITLVEIPRGMVAADTARCAEAFLIEIRQQHGDAFWRPETPPLQIGPQEVPVWRWAGGFDSVPQTGLVACMALEGSFLAVAVADSIADAPLSFPALRKSLRGLELR